MDSLSVMLPFVGADTNLMKVPHNNRSSVPRIMSLYWVTDSSLDARFLKKKVNSLVADDVKMTFACFTFLALNHIDCSSLYLCGGFVAELITLKKRHLITLNLNTDIRVGDDLTV